MTADCPVCGKEFDILYPGLWAYKQGTKFFHTYSCLQKYREQMTDKRRAGTMKITLEHKKKAVEIAANGGNPLEYLRGLGCRNPSAVWSNIKMKLRGADPETYAKLPDMRKKKETAPAAVVKVDGPIRIETEEPEKVEVSEPDKGWTKYEPEIAEEKPKITQPVGYDGFKVRAVSGVFGRYSYSETRSAYIDYENNDGDELSMTLEQWRGFLDELRRAALVLGVEL